jgi:hypothetical protein
MKIKDPNMLKFFGKNPNTKRSKKGYTPADLSKQYDLNVYRKILADPTSDKMQRETAQLMIQNYNLKLGALALAQESLKGFDRGLPAIGVPMLQRFGVEPSKLVEGQKPEDFQQQDKRVAQADMMSKKQKQEQQFRFGGHYATGGMTNPNDMSASCPKGQGWNGILETCQPLEELRMFYLNMNPADPRRNSVLSELSQGRTNTDGYWAGLIDGDAYADHFYHVGSQISREFGPGGYAWGNKRPNFSTDYSSGKPSLVGKVLKRAVNKETYGGPPDSYATLGDVNTIPGMSDAAIAYQNSLSGVEPVPGPVDYTFKDVNAPSGREGFTMIHGVEDGEAENQYWVPDAEATGV